MELRGGGFLQLAEHLRPEVAAEFGVARGRDYLLEEIFHLFVVPFATHFALTSMPRQLSFLRSNRTARNTRTLTSATDMPAALAMLLYGSSSIRASVATRRYFAGSSWKAVLMRSRDSRRIAGSAPVAHGRSWASRIRDANAAGGRKRR